MINQVCLVGNLSQDVTLRQTQDGKAVASFSIAVNGYNDRVDFFNIVVWGKQAENCSKFIKKGSKIGICGRLQNRSYEANDGSKRTVCEVVAEEIDFLSPKSEKQEPKQATMEEIEDDMLPF